MGDGRHIIAEAVAAIRSPDINARQAARELQACLTKPAGSLGRLEDLYEWAAGVYRTPVPDIARRAIVVVAADHGVVREGVSAYPESVTSQMVRNMLAGGAAVNVLARQAGAEVLIVDAGVATDIDDEGLFKVKRTTGSSNLAEGPALLRSDAEALVTAGILLAQAECTAGPCLIGLGDMGIGNTTAAAAITAVLTGTPPHLTAGRGTGIDDATFERKISTIERALRVNEPDPTDPLDVLAKVGGCELAVLAGAALGAASCGAAVVLDGYPTTAAALIAAALAPHAREYMLASHMSTEPGHRLALGALDLIPVLDFGMRLGEGTGAALAMTVLDAALRLPREMATFESAGVSRSVTEVRPET
jgi:nicotinate-nucleotide--dimethylbenzimidazole phosphoribosyltransferase